MHKGKCLLPGLAALSTAITVALVLASSVTAATVTHTILLNDETEPFHVCSFPLSASFHGTVRLTEIHTAQGVQLLFTSVGPTTVTVTNPANGTSVTGMGQTAGEILKIGESSFVDHLNGITLSFVLPGLGGVLQVIGNIDFADGSFNGRNTRGDTTAFCNYLAGP